MDVVANKNVRVLLSPTMFYVASTKSLGIVNEVQISAFAVQSKSFMREAQYIFPTTDLSNLIAIPTMQHAKQELVKIGDEIEQEKDRLILSVSYSIISSSNFYIFAKISFQTLIYDLPSSLTLLSWFATKYLVGEHIGLIILTRVLDSL